MPTPINSSNDPDLSYLKDASSMVGAYLKIGDVVVYESTVYPGCTEEICVPILETCSELKLNQGFFCGYSPERINPGDKKHRITDIVKVTSGSTAAAADYINEVYNLIISAGTHRAPSIRVAEAAKVIENTQRDLNIALMNELAIIFGKLNISTEDVLDAAGSKWNFLPFRPGMVGGHCISVDPYYLTHKAQEIGYHPEVILSGRRVNDYMAQYACSILVKHMSRGGLASHDAKILVMGLSFKENCPDIRNTKVFDMVLELRGYGFKVDVYDPWVSSEVAKEEYNLDLVEKPKANFYDAIVVAVGHSVFKEMGANKLRSFGVKGGILFDVKWCFNKNEVDIRL